MINWKATHQLSLRRREFLLKELFEKERTMYAEMKTIGGLKGSLESIDASASSPTESKSTAFAEVRAALDACVDACAKGDTKGDTKDDAKGDTGSVEIANTEIQSQKQNVVTAAAAHAEIVPRINEPIREDVSRELPKKNAVSVDSPEKDLNDKISIFRLEKMPWIMIRTSRTLQAL